MHLHCVSPDLIPRAWQVAEPYIRRASERMGMGDVDYVAESIKKDQARLWLACEGKEIIGAGVTEIIEEPQGRVCNIVSWSSDDQKKCAPLLSIVHEYAKAEGCTRARLIGRKGWAKVLKDYKIKALIMERPV